MKSEPSVYIGFILENAWFEQSNLRLVKQFYAIKIAKIRKEYLSREHRLVIVEVLKLLTQFLS